MHMHMVLTWDHKSPEDYRNAARKNILENYSSIQFVDVAVAEISKESDSYFKVRDANTYPNIDGYEQLWKKRIFHCLFCHGYEDRNAPSSGVLAVAPVTIYTNGDVEIEGDLKPLVSSLVVSKFNIETRQIKRLVGGDTLRSVTVERAPKAPPFVAHLGLDMTPSGGIKADAPSWQTSVPGVFAVGDCSTPYKVIASAVTSGCNAGVMASAEIQGQKYSRSLDS
ncbi:hypothetical protein MGN70_010850 [Eutypa lata]|nr:hypothetical protein MGN70_010850 [Eutypa lata]